MTNLCLNMNSGAELNRISTPREGEKEREAKLNKNRGAKPNKWEEQGGEQEEGAKLNNCVAELSSGPAKLYHAVTKLNI